MKKKILFIESGHFFGEIIAGMISREIQGEIRTTAPANLDDLKKVVEQEHPDVIIVDDSLESMSLSELLDYLNVFPEMHLVVVSVNNNQVYTYQKQQITVRQSADFFATLM